MDLVDLRVKIDQMNERIVSRLKDRSRFKLNEKVYIPNAIEIKGRKNISFLEFALEGLEAYHSMLGRYDYKEQIPIFSNKTPHSPVKREPLELTLSKVNITVKDDLLKFYKNALPEFCEKGDDPTTYGETVYVDADLLELVHERIASIGRLVAQSKLESGVAVKDKNTEELKAMLRSVKREAEVIRKARETAAKYELDPDFAEKIFGWIIEETIKVEMEYIQKV